MGLCVSSASAPTGGCSKRTSTLGALCPRTSLAESLRVWATADFSDLRTRPASPRFLLCSDGVPENAPIHVFVSHTWYDRAFLRALNVLAGHRTHRPIHGSVVATVSHDNGPQADSFSATGGITPKKKHSKEELSYVEMRYFDLKSAGLRKAMAQLAVRPGIIADQFFPDDLDQWRVWMDLVCIDQYDEQHKAHVTEQLDSYVQEAGSMVVILSPGYFSRLWCVYECCSFLAHHDVDRMAVYVWGFSDSLTVNPSRMASASEEVRSIARATPDALRSFSVASAQCTFESDRKLLLKKVDDFYVSHAAFERFARLVGIVMASWSLILSPAVYFAERYRQQILPWLDLARDVGFAGLADALSAFDAVAVYALHDSCTPPERVPAYVEAAQSHFREIMKFVENERAVALKSPKSVSVAEVTSPTAVVAAVVTEVVAMVVAKAEALPPQHIIE